MIRNPWGISALLLLLVLATACSLAPSAPAQPGTPAAAPTVELPTPAPLATSTTAPQPTLAPSTTQIPQATLPLATAPATASPTRAATRAATTAPVQACENSAFVADITVPDGTRLAPGQAFNKIWRLRNTGACAWNGGYALAPVGGTALGGSALIAVPNTAPGATVDITVPMTAPATPGTYTSNWRLRNASGASFGATVWAKITVVPIATPFSVGTPAPAPTLAPTTIPPSTCAGAPTIESFTAAPVIIPAGATTTLSWGLVANADAAEIDNDIGGVATPGSITVNPATTTTYTLTAICGTTTRTAQVTVQVIPPGVTPTATRPTENTPTRVPTSIVTPLP